MEWLDGLLGIAATAGSGGLFGVIGGLVGAVGKYFGEKQRQAWEVQKHAMMLDTMKMRQQIAASQGSWDGLTAAMTQQREPESSNVHMWVNDIRSLFRPMFTIMLWVLSAYIFYLLLNGVLDSKFKAEGGIELVKYIVHSVIFTAATAGTWWFADRALMPPGAKSR